MYTEHLLPVGQARQFTSETSISNEEIALASATVFFAYLLPFLNRSKPEYNILSRCKGDYQINKGYIDGKYQTIPAHGMRFPQDCHERCREDDTCEAWAWTNGTETGECSLHKWHNWHIGPNSKESRFGYIIGTKNSCKLDCFELIRDQKADTNTQICDNTGCTSMIYKTPSEFESEDEIVMCYKEEDEYVCGDLDYEYTGYCNSQPVDQRLSSWGYWGSGYPMPWWSYPYYCY